MIVSIHQPIHFPYLGFFEKMKMADVFVILDTVKFCKNEYYNRNKFKNNSGNDEWFTITVEKEAHKKNIKDVLVVDPRLWKKKLLRKLNLKFKEDFTKVYSSNKLVDINMASIYYCKEKLNIDTPLILASSLNIEGKSTERLVNICKKLNASKYISGPNGKQYLDEKLFGDIEVQYYSPKVENYYSTLYNLYEKSFSNRSSS
jgi:hypothetical protein